MVGFIVEGHMEADIIKHLCPRAHVRRLQMNGCDFPTDRICDRILPQIRMLQRGKLMKIVVVIDREQRDFGSVQFEQTIRSELESRQINCSDILIISPDRNFESWIVPFINEQCELTAHVHAKAEGMNGKAVIKQKFRKAGKTYVETVDGVKLFKLVNPQQLATFSESFRRFSENFSEECWWLQKEQRQ